MSSEDGVSLFRPSGAALWAMVTDAFRLDPAEMAVLRQLCRTVDELDRLDEALRDAHMMVKGSTGQPAANPLLEQVRAHRKVLESLCRSLALPVDGEVTGSVRHPQQAGAARSRHRSAALRSARSSGGVS
jgi:hypothetical protein